MAIARPLPTAPPPAKYSPFHQHWPTLTSPLSHPQHQHARSTYHNSFIPPTNILPPMPFCYLHVTHHLLCILSQHMPLTLLQSLLCIPTNPTSTHGPIYCTLPTHYPRRHIPPHHSCRNFCHHIRLPLTPYYTSNLFLSLRRSPNSPTNTINALTPRTQLRPHTNSYPGTCTPRKTLSYVYSNHSPVQLPAYPSPA